MFAGIRGRVVSPELHVSRISSRNTTFTYLSLTGRGECIFIGILHTARCVQAGPEKGFWTEHKGPLKCPR